MKKQKQIQPKPKQIFSLAIKEKLIEVLKAGVSHPVTTSLLIMTGAVIVKSIAMASIPKEDRDIQIDNTDPTGTGLQIGYTPRPLVVRHSGATMGEIVAHEMVGLYKGAQSIATAAVVVPVITTALSAAGSAASAYLAPTPQIAGKAPP